MNRLVEEFLKRGEFKDLKVKEPGVLEHMEKLFGHIGDGIKDGIIHEVF